MLKLVRAVLAILLLASVVSMTVTAPSAAAPKPDCTGGYCN